MLCIRFSILLSLVFHSLNSFAAFNDDECLKSTFSATVSHKAFPMGMTDTTLSVKKDTCLITVEHSSLKFMKKRWMIDVCRGPIHIKHGTSSIDVLKRVGTCKGIKQSEYCANLSELELILQDDGLIFADGDKDNINEDHGRLYCSYMLVLAYLEKGMVFSTAKSYDKVLTRGIYKAEMVEPTGKPLLSLPTTGRKTIETDASGQAAPTSGAGRAEF